MLKSLKAIWPAGLLTVVHAASMAAQADVRPTPAAPGSPPIPLSILSDGKPFPRVTPFVARFHEARRTFFVSAKAENGDGSEAHPWSDLQAALCALEAGDRLRVRAGTYPGALRIDAPCRDGTFREPIQVFFDGKARIKPRGDAPALTVARAHWRLVGLFLELGESAAAGVSIEGSGARDVALEGARLAGGAGPGLRIGRESARVTVSGARIEKPRVGKPGLESFGIEIEAGARDVLITNNHLHENPAGSIRVDAPAKGGRPASQLRILSNGIRDDGSTAISVKAADHIHIAGNTISDATVGGETRGITLENVRRGVVRSNHISGCAMAIRVGRADPEGTVESVEDLSIDRNYLEMPSPGGTALDIEAGNRVRFANNVIEGYADGILVLGRLPRTRAMTVANNLVLFVSDVAFALEDPESAAFFDYNVFSPQGEDTSVQVRKESLPIARFLKGGTMPHTRLTPGAQILSRDLARVSGALTVDQGKALEGIKFRGSAPDIGVAER